MSGRSSALAPAPPARLHLPAQESGVLPAGERARVLEIVRAFLEAPTAPYAEDAQLDVIRRFVAEREGFASDEDEYGNLVVTWPGAQAPTHAGARAPTPDGAHASSRAHARTRSTAPILAFSAHLDHPGFLYAGRVGKRHTAVFHGGVPERYFAGAPVRFFDLESREPVATATVSELLHEERDLVAVLADLRGEARDGMFGMWDLTPAATRGRRLHARVCDDLLGAAAILCTLDHLSRARHPEPVVGIFTRAEETGFIGCQGLLRSGRLPADLAVVGLECSPRRPTAKVGFGPVVRVGDRESVFDLALTHHLQLAAEFLRERVPPFRVQRALMDGGSCESTAYNAWGVRAGGLCLALGNYHNCGADGRIAAEFVDWHDLEGLIALMQAAVESWDGGAGASAKMRARLDRIWLGEYKRLVTSGRRIRAGPRSWERKRSGGDGGNGVG